MVAQGPPGIRRKQARRGLYRCQHRNRQQPHALALQPQRQVRGKKAYMGEVAGRKQCKRGQLAAADRLPTGRRGHQIAEAAMGATG